MLCLDLFCGRANNLQRVTIYPIQLKLFEIHLLNFRSLPIIIDSWAFTFFYSKKSKLLMLTIIMSQSILSSRGVARESLTPPVKAFIMWMLDGRGHALIGND